MVPLSDFVICVTLFRSIIGHERIGASRIRLVNCCIHLRIYGLVQGVWYRGSMVEQAVARNLDGWVRNRQDGSVEAIVAGDQTAVRDLIAWCRRGPPSARVDEIKETSIENRVAGKGFRQVATC